MNNEYPETMKAQEKMLHDQKKEIERLKEEKDFDEKELKNMIRRLNRYSLMLNELERKRQ